MFGVCREAGEGAKGGEGEEIEIEGNCPAHQVIEFKICLCTDLYLYMCLSDHI